MAQPVTLRYQRKKASQDPQSVLDMFIAQQSVRDQSNYERQQARDQSMMERQLLRDELMTRRIGMQDILKRQAESRKPQITADTALAKQRATMGPEREILVQNVARMKKLADQVPAGRPGIDRFKVGAQAAFRGFTQELPQLNTYNRFKKVVLGGIAKVVGGETGSRLSDQDVKRMEGAWPNLPYDSGDQRTLSWVNFFDTVNDVASKYGAQPIELEQLLSSDELTKGRELQFGNSNTSDSNNSDIEERKKRLRNRYLGVSNGSN